MVRLSNNNDADDEDDDEDDGDKGGMEPPAPAAADMVVGVAMGLAKMKTKGRDRETRKPQKRGGRAPPEMERGSRRDPWNRRVL